MNTSTRFIVRAKKRKAELFGLNWKVAERDVNLVSERLGLPSKTSAADMLQRNVPHFTAPYQIVSLKGKVACLYLFRKAPPDLTKTKTLLEIEQVSDNAQCLLVSVTDSVIILFVFLITDFPQIKNLHNDFLSTFLGCLIGSEEHDGIIMDYGGKSNLEELVSNPKLKFDKLFQYSTLRDIALGMNYLHHSAIESHGRLRSTCIIMDKKFVPKISEFGLPSFQVRQLLHLNFALLNMPHVFSDHFSLSRR